MGTGLCAPASGHELPTISAGHVHELKSAPSRSELIKRMTKLEADAELVGFVVEDSRIGAIRFEMAGAVSLAEGHVVFCRQGEVPVFYQLLDAYTTEESFDRNPHGTRVVTASQLGSPDRARGFSWYPWVPEMNTPVFLPAERLGLKPNEAALEGFEIGTIPGTDLSIRADFELLARYHTAVLGTTGMGKTEFVFDIIREGLRQGAKIICIDFTGEYAPRLNDLNPVSLSLPENAAQRIAELTEAVETGKFGGAEEKRSLLDYLAEARPAVQVAVDTFLSEPDGSVGIFELEDIANTRATLRATEMMLSEVFGWARNNRQARKILLILEEAHTIIPEVNFYGYDKSETSAVVGRMSQIALQGRKYGVGLLLVSQRTALVSKTVLSQCNTVFSFALVDRTGLDYLQNVYSSQHVLLLPNLRPRQMVAFGKGVRTDRPVVVEIPFDPEKQQAAEDLAVKAFAIDSEEGQR
jgi:uncharacterized protein